MNMMGCLLYLTGLFKTSIFFAMDYNIAGGATLKMINPILLTLKTNWHFQVKISNVFPPSVSWEYNLLLNIWRHIINIFCSPPSFVIIHQKVHYYFCLVREVSTILRYHKYPYLLSNIGKAIEPILSHITNFTRFCYSLGGS